jgi:hypothetical protein
MRALLAFALAATSLAASSAGAGAAPPPHTRPLGGVNLTAYCQLTFGANYISKLLGPTAGDWRCVIARGGRGYGGGGYGGKSISVKDACREQYGRNDLIAYAVWSDPYSWKCYPPNRGGY